MYSSEIFLFYKFAPRYNKNYGVNWAKKTTRISRSLEQAKNIMTSKENDNYSKLEELKVRPLKIYENWQYIGFFKDLN